MSSYAPIWNHGYSQKLLIYGLTQKGHVNLRQCNIRNKGKPTDPTQTATLPDGNIPVPSALVGLHIDCLTRVYGIIKKKDANGTLYMLSPVAEAMPTDDISTTSASLASIVLPSDDSEMTPGSTIYRILRDLKGQKTRVCQLDLQGKNAPKPFDTVDLQENTSLAACLGVKQRRFLAYQVTDGHIEIFEVGKGRKKKYNLGVIKSGTDLLATLLNNNNNNNNNNNKPGVAENANVPAFYCVAVDETVIGTPTYNGGDALDVLWNDVTTATNRSSIAIIIAWQNGRVSHYFAGDLNWLNECRLVKWLNRGAQTEERIPTVKASHHGSCSSTPPLLLYSFRPVNIAISAATSIII
ncbi:hypothetical protein B0T10DRAFT_589605 [Thelonectria olida]|uniref:Uncharacterized protein n=1 Tax=Thelonectria olida TaxID=1576542 RepID=A0A9P8WAF2_9HYPO|nr:hypothetical protein B0T10DRAFT_589605 [Thelonectria olida]